MGIVRYSIECPGCQSTIRLRLGVGIEPQSKFFLVCRTCNVVTHAVQYFSEELVETRLKLTEGRILKGEPPCSQTTTIHPDMPSLGSDDEKFSPFLLQHEILGKRLGEFGKRLGTFREGIASNWPSVERLITYYVDKHWLRFDNECHRVLKEAYPAIPSALHRHDAIHMMIRILFSPLWVQDYFPRIQSHWVRSAIQSNPHSNVLKVFTKTPEYIGEIESLQRDVFHCICLIVKHRAAILPGLAADMYPAGAMSAARNLRLFHDGFPELRDLYIAIFEVCHKSLKYAVACENISKRGDANAFESGKPKSLHLFSKLTSAEKTKVIERDPEWKCVWSEVLDCRIRNAIGHHSVRHDYASGKLVFENGSPISYLEFVVKTLRSSQAILIASDILKYLRIVADFDSPQ